MANSSPLNRTLSLKLATVLVVGNIIGSGVYKKAAPMAAELHSPGWIIICWILGGVVTLLGALSNAEIASLLADTGGEYSYYKKIYNRFFSFLYGWSNFAAIKTAAIAGIAYVFAQSFHSMVHLPPLLPQWEHFTIAGVFSPFKEFNIKLTAITLILLLTWLNSGGLKTGVGLSSLLLVLMLTGITIIAVFGLSSPQAEVKEVFTMATTDGSTVSFSAVFTAMLAAFWAYEGWNSVGFLGGEIKNPHRNVPLSIVLGLLLVISTYLLANIAYLAVLPVPTLETISNTPGAIVAVEAVKTFWSAKGSFFISLLILVSTLGCTHATILSNARVYYAMAKEGVFFRRAARINKAQVPGAALWIQGFWACMLVLSGSFDQITDMLIFAAFIYYGATTVGVFILRQRMPDAVRPYKVWGYPVVPAIFILFCILLIGNTLIQRPREAGIGLTLILVGVPLYLWFTKGERSSKD